MFYLTQRTQQILFTVIWRQTYGKVPHMGYSFRLAARVLLHAPSHRQDSTYHGLWSTGWNKK